MCENTGTSLENTDFAEYNLPEIIVIGSLKIGLTSYSQMSVDIACSHQIDDCQYICMEPRL